MGADVFYREKKGSVKKKLDDDKMCARERKQIIKTFAVTNFHLLALYILFYVRQKARRERTGGRPRTHGGWRRSRCRAVACGFTPQARQSALR